MKNNKRTVRLNEAVLHNIIKESIKKVLSEAYNTQQYAHLAGQADGAVNSFKGKLKGLVKPSWKKRKKRQIDLFGNGGDSPYNRVGPRTCARDENSGYNHDFFSNTYLGDDGDDTPYMVGRDQYNIDDKMRAWEGPDNDDVMTSQEFREKHPGVRGGTGLAYDTWAHNNAYRLGKQVGKKRKPKNGSGTDNTFFKHLGRNNRDY